MEAVNKFYLEDGCVESVVNFLDEINESNEVIYEVLRVVNGKPLFVKEHINRMEKSFALINKDFPYSYDKIDEYINKVIEVNEKVEGNIKITYSTTTDSIKVYYIKHNYPSKELYIHGVKTILYHGERQNPNAKIVNKSFREIVNDEIFKASAYEAILVDENGYITEGSKSNIFILKDNKLITAKAKNVLKGVTREHVIALAKANNVEVKETEIRYTELSNVDAMFISGTSPKILPIRQVDNIELNVNNGIMRMLMEKYELLTN